MPASSNILAQMVFLRGGVSTLMYSSNDEPLMCVLFAEIVQGCVNFQVCVCVQVCTTASALLLYPNKQLI